MWCILVHNWQSQVTSIYQYSSDRCFTSIRDRDGDAVQNAASMTQSTVHMVEYQNLPHIPLIRFDMPWRVFKIWCLLAACLSLACNWDRCLFKAGLYSGKYRILPLLLCYCHAAVTCHCHACCFAIHDMALPLSCCFPGHSFCHSHATWPPSCDWATVLKACHGHTALPPS